MEILAITTTRIDETAPFRHGGGIAFFMNILPYLTKKHNISLVAPSESGKAIDFEYMGANVSLTGNKLDFPRYNKSLISNPPGRFDACLLLEPIAIVLFARKRKKLDRKVVGVAHHFFRPHMDVKLAVRAPLAAASLPLEVILEPLVRKAFGSLDSVIVSSDVFVDHLKKLGAKRTHLIEIGIPERYKPGRKENYAVVVSRLEGYKQVDKCIRAAREANVNLHIVGEGSAGKGLKKLGWAEFHGYLAEDKKIELLGGAKFLLSMSMVEGFGMTLVEGMACGAVPVVSDIPAHRFVLGESGVGMLVRSWEEMRDSLTWLIENEQERKKMARKGLRLVKKRFTARRMAERYMEILEG